MHHYRRFVALFSALLLVLSLGAGSVFAQEGDGDAAPNTLEEITGTDEFYNQTVTFEGFVNELVNSSILVVGENAALDDDRVLVVDNSSRPFPLRVTKGARVLITGTVVPSLDVFQADPSTITVAIDNGDEGAMVETVPETNADDMAEGEGDMAEATEAADMAEGEGDAVEIDASPTPMSLSDGGDLEAEATEEGDMAEGDMAEATEEADMAEGEGDIAEATEEADMAEGEGDTEMLEGIRSPLRFIYNGELIDDFNNFTIVIIDSIEVLEGPDSQ